MPMGVIAFSASTPASTLIAIDRLTSVQWPEPVQGRSGAVAQFHRGPAVVLAAKNPPAAYTRSVIPI